MSHFTDIDLSITDLDALRDACAELNLPFEPHAEARGYAGRTVQAEGVIRLSGPYDVAVLPDGKGGYKLAADLWQGHVEAELGVGFGRLKQFYGVHKTMREAKHKGLRIRRNNHADGRIRLTLTTA